MKLSKLFSKKSVNYYHRKDGKITVTTKIRHKGVFGNTYTDTYSETIDPNAPRKGELDKSKSAAAIICTVADMLIIFGGMYLSAPLPLLLILCVAADIATVVLIKKHKKSDDD